MRARGFPPYILACVIMSHWAPRLIESAGFWSEVIQINRSCVPGCVTAGECARGYIYTILEYLHSGIPML
eukprot:8512468-Lingulodinium_polyedra.AAC.1